MADGKVESGKKDTKNGTENTKTDQQSGFPLLIREVGETFGNQNVAFVEHSMK